MVTTQSLRRRAIVNQPKIFSRETERERERERGRFPYSLVFILVSSRPHRWWTRVGGGKSNDGGASRVKGIPKSLIAAWSTCWRRWGPFLLFWTLRSSGRHTRPIASKSALENQEGCRLKSRVDAGHFHVRALKENVEKKGKQTLIRGVFKYH